MRSRSLREKAHVMGATTSLPTQKNRILATVPQAELDRFFSSLQPVSLALKQVLCEAGGPLECIYFIEEGVASVLTRMTDGSTIEVGMIRGSYHPAFATQLGDERARRALLR